MKVLIPSLVYPPDNVSTAHVVGRLALELRKAGHEVVVLTSTPHYHPGDVAAWRRAPDRVLGPLVLRSRADGVVAYHVWMPGKANPVPVRLLSWVWFHLVTTLLGLFAARGTDIILAPSPPLTIGLTAWVLGALRGVPFVYNVQEVYPDVAVTLGAIRQPWLIRLFHAIESWVYARARAVTVIGSGMRTNLLLKGVPPDKVVTIPNFVDPDELPVRPRDNGFARTHGLLGVFVVSYAGNFGVPQGLGTVLDAARRLRDQSGILFVLVGDGAALGALRAQVEREALANVRLLPFQPYALVPDIYASSDICLVPQAEGTGLQGLPSKIYRIMACGRPIVGICDADSEVAALIVESGCGTTVRPGDSSALAGAVSEAFADRERWSSRGAQGRQFVQNAYSVERVAGQYIELLEGLASAGRD